MPCLGQTWHLFYTSGEHWGWRLLICIRGFWRSCLKGERSFLNAGYLYFVLCMFVQVNRWRACATVALEVLQRLCNLLMSMILCDFFCLNKIFCWGCHHLFLCSKAQRTWYHCLDLQQKMNCNVWILELMLPLNNLKWSQVFVKLEYKYTSTPCIDFIWYVPT